MQWAYGGEIREEAVLRAAAHVLNAFKALDVLAKTSGLPDDDAAVNVRRVRRVLYQPEFGGQLPKFYRDVCTKVVW